MYCKKEFWRYYEVIAKTEGYFEAKDKFSWKSPIEKVASKVAKVETIWKVSMLNNEIEQCPKHLFFLSDKLSQYEIC